MTALENALLEVGLEDLIALPETLQLPELNGLIDRSDPIPEVVAALTVLLRSGRIQVWAGRWPDEPEMVDSATAEKLLAVPASYEFRSSADLDRRVYYVNVNTLSRAEMD